MTHHVDNLEDAIDRLVYLHAAPPARVRQARRVEHALVDVVLERHRQETIGLEKRAAGIPWRSCADPAMEGGDMTRTVVLAEEFGEVANAVLERVYGAHETDEHLRSELIQTAAVCMAWVESIDESNEDEGGGS